MKIEFYYVNYSYLEFLKQKERIVRGFTCVPNTVYKSENTKFFYGTVLNVNGINYFVPISSHVHKSQDDLQIICKDRKNPNYGTLRFRYMLPVPDQCLTLLIRDNLDTYQSERIRKELAFCRKNRDKILRQAEKTYHRIVNGNCRALKDNSCDFKLLESACFEYINNSAPSPKSPPVCPAETQRSPDL